MRKLLEFLADDVFVPDSQRLNEIIADGGQSSVVTGQPQLLHDRITGKTFTRRIAGGLELVTPGDPLFFRGVAQVLVPEFIQRGIRKAAHPDKKGSLVKRG